MSSLLLLLWQVVNETVNLVVFLYSQKINLMVAIEKNYVSANRDDDTVGE